jgi:hypothetical protein
MQPSSNSSTDIPTLTSKLVQLEKEHMKTKGLLFQSQVTIEEMLKEKEEKNREIEELRGRLELIGSGVSVP